MCLPAKMQQSDGAQTSEVGEIAVGVVENEH